jgi:hypothetical protein
LERVTGGNLFKAIREYVEVGSTVCTDDFLAYRAMPKVFTRKFFLLKRGIIGTFTKSAKRPTLKPLKRGLHQPKK